MFTEIYLLPENNIGSDFILQLLDKLNFRN